MEMIGAFDPVLLVELARGDAFTVDYIKTNVAAALRVSLFEIDSVSREQHIALARMIAMYLVRRDTGLSWGRIGQLFNRDHSTTIHAHRTIANRMAAESQFRVFVNAIVQSRN